MSAKPKNNWGEASRGAPSVLSEYGICFLLLKSRDYVD